MKETLNTKMIVNELTQWVWVRTHDREKCRKVAQTIRAALGDHGVYDGTDPWLADANDWYVLSQYGQQVSA